MTTPAGPSRATPPPGVDDGCPYSVNFSHSSRDNFMDSTTPLVPTQSMREEGPLKIARHTPEDRPYPCGGPILAIVGTGPGGRPTSGIDQTSPSATPWP